jgi:phosphoribosylformimino-5-aminoimidazole carboxamide ribotide isomerase
MEVIPAIDLRGGKCVRLYQGDYSQETVFSESPVNVAMSWQALGAPRLHIVDLDGAARGMPCNTPVIEEILHAIQIPAQLGGGIRHLETIEKLLQVGIQRVILGTAAVEDIELVREACQRFGEAIVIGVDAKDDYIATHGWQENR